MLGALVAAQWGATAVFAAVVRHNGWLFYQGGDELFYWTDSWVVSHGHIPESVVGYGWPLVLAPFSAAFGANLAAALPAILLFQVLVLGPVALLCVYGIAARCGGPRLGYLACLLWIALPYLVVPLWVARYHVKYVEQFLPEALGLTGLSEYPSLVALLVAGLFCLRALDSGELVDGAVAGLAAGFAIGIKPSNAIFLAAPAAAFLLARRLLPAGAFAAALVPAVLALALWKLRGLGHLPLISPQPHALALGGTPFADSSRYLHLDAGQLRKNVDQLREFMPVAGLLATAPLAGGVALARRSLPKAAFLLVWLGAFVLVRGSSPSSSIEEGTFLRLFLPAAAPYVLLVASIGLFVPDLARDDLAPARHDRRAWIAAAAVVFGLVPVLVLAVLRPLHAPRTTKYFVEHTAVVVDDGFSVRVTPSTTGRDLAWTAPSSPGLRTFFRVFRSRSVATAPDPSLPPGRDGIRCLPPTGGAADCRLEMEVIGTTREPQWHDPDRPRGAWTYRVGLAANWLDDPNLGDILLLSRAATFRGR